MWFVDSWFQVACSKAVSLLVQTCIAKWLGSTDADMGLHFFQWLGHRCLVYHKNYYLTTSHCIISSKDWAIVGSCDGTFNGHRISVVLQLFQTFVLGHSDLLELKGGETLLLFVCFSTALAALVGEELSQSQTNKLSKQCYDFLNAKLSSVVQVWDDPDKKGLQGANCG